MYQNIIIVDIINIQMGTFNERTLIVNSRNNYNSHVAQFLAWYHKIRKLSLLSHLLYVTRRTGKYSGERIGFDPRS